MMSMRVDTETEPQQAFPFDGVTPIAGPGASELVYRTDDISQHYHVSNRAVGVGINGNVLLCSSKKDGQTFALKILPNNDRARRELKLHYMCQSHPNIVKIIDVFQHVNSSGSQRLLCIMEYMKGGELLDRIQSLHRFTENMAARIMSTLAQVVQHMHALGIAHRDLKPENILFIDKSPDSDIKLSDFGFAKAEETPCKTACYTPYYVAPEILKAELYGETPVNYSYDKACDVWSLGVICYILIAGYPPFFSYSGGLISPGMKHRIRSGHYDFPAEDWDRVSPECVTLIQRCLLTNPTKRATIDEVQRSQWIMNHTNVPMTPLNVQNMSNADLAQYARNEFSRALEDMRIDETHNLSDLNDVNSSLLAKRKAKKEKQQQSGEDRGSGSETPTNGGYSGSGDARGSADGQYRTSPDSTSTSTTGAELTGASSVIRVSR